MERPKERESRTAAHMLLGLPLVTAVGLLLSPALPPIVEKAGQEIARLEMQVWEWGVQGSGQRFQILD